ncbi:HAD family hydrolase [Azospirillum sp. TSO35-2]|uniref:HAD family hydrolase n=1 Tax=Azospirillum sp. TSO35-2 TaxID=716796 RepID=UPI000D6181B2|nr:HAD family hydrolase [Azospirillum sp. TSO35-2]PWC37536.1 hydrolase [Azospirillum sp. TSO35-2]
MGAGTQLVIFDCDGVLVDSEPISIAVLVEGIRAAGAVIDESVAYRRFLGRSLGSIGSILLEEYGLCFDAAHQEAMRARLFDRFRAALQPIPGVADTLSRLGRRRCVASSSQPDRIRLSLTVTGLLEYFDGNIYSSAMVKSGKPAPDLFLHAAQGMGADPAGCVVVEDSPAGIEAAKRAGMRVFAFVGGSHAEPAGLRRTVEALAPDLVFDDMRQLPRLLDGGRLDGEAARETV